jgi:hypothetical protein
MSTDLFNAPISAPKASRGQAKGNAAPIGSGPAGETCRTCAHSYGLAGGSKHYFKCRLVKATSGPGSDIRLKWAACARWQAASK